MEQCRPPNEEECLVLQKMQDDACDMFQPDSQPAHEEMLKRVWNTFHDNVHGIEKPFERHHADWQKIGFQGSDPVSDIRGGGVLAVAQILYFFEHHTDVAVGIAEANEPEATGEEFNYEGPYYPFATASIHVSAMLLELFGVRNAAGAKTDFTKKEQPFFHLAATAESYHDLYCFAVELLDQTFDEEGGTYLTFPEIEKKMKGKLELALRSGGADTVEELARRMRFQRHRKSLPALEKQRISEYRESLGQRLSNQVGRRFSFAGAGASRSRSTSAGSAYSGSTRTITEETVEEELSTKPSASRKESIEMVPPPPSTPSSVLFTLPPGAVDKSGGDGDSSGGGGVAATSALDEGDESKEDASSADPPPADDR